MEQLTIARVTMVISNPIGPMAQFKNRSDRAASVSARTWLTLHFFFNGGGDSLARAKKTMKPGKLFFRIMSGSQGTVRSRAGSMRNSAPNLSAIAPIIGPQMNVGAEAATACRQRHISAHSEGYLMVKDSMRLR